MAGQFLFIMDPIEGIDIDADSTFVLMLEAQRRGYTLLYAQPQQLMLRGAEPWVIAQPAQLRRQRGAHVELGPPAEHRLGAMAAVFMRKDPPFDADFLMATYILERVPPGVVMVNAPQALRDYNEKLAALYWPELMPPTLITADRPQARAFIEAQGRAVIKPLSGAGGAGVLKLSPEDPNLGSALDLLTLEGRRHIEVQGYIEAVQAGDKRVILLEGEAIGAVNRVPQGGDIRSNLHVGGRAEPAPLTPRDLEIAAALQPELRRRGLIFVGIDVIGGYLTEVNVTSPTGLQEIDRFDQVSLEAQIIDRVISKIPAA